MIQKRALNSNQSNKRLNELYFYSPNRLSNKLFYRFPAKEFRHNPGYDQQHQKYSQMIMTKQFVQSMVHKVDIDLVYDVQFKADVSKVNKNLITKYVVKNATG